MPITSSWILLVIISASKCKFHVMANAYGKEECQVLIVDHITKQMTLDGWTVNTWVDINMLTFWLWDIKLAFHVKNCRELFIYNNNCNLTFHLIFADYVVLIKNVIVCRIMELVLIVGSILIVLHPQISLFSLLLSYTMCFNVLLL